MHRFKGKLPAHAPRTAGLVAIVAALVFAPALERLGGADRQRRLAQFVAICDVYTWKLLRRDAGLSRRQTELALVEVLEPLTEVR